MINILTVKFGNKFTHKHVNLLYNSIKKHYTGDFTFYCLTDNANGLDPDIKFSIREEEFCYAFNKVSLMKKNFNNLSGDDKVVIMDLDIDVLNDPSPIFNINLNENQLGLFHKWWQFPYKGCWIWGGIYVGTHKLFNNFYDRLTHDPEHFYTVYTNLYGYRFREDMPIKGEQDFILESAILNNYSFNIFPHFYVENIQPELEFGNYPPNFSLKRIKMQNRNNSRLQTYIHFKENSNPISPIFKHYSGSINSYIKKYESSN